MADLAEEVPDVELRDKATPRDEPGAEPFHRLRGAPPRPEPERARKEARLEHRLQHDPRRLLRHPAADRRNAGRPPPAIWLRDVHAPGRRGTARALAQASLKPSQQTPNPVLPPHVIQGDLVHPGRPPARPHAAPRLPHDVTPADTVIQGAEPAPRRQLGRSPQPPLQFSHVHRVRPQRTGSRRRREPATTGQRPAGGIGPGRPGHALPLTLAESMIKARALPSRRVPLHADHRYHGPLGLPLPSRRLHHRLTRLVFARRRPGRRASPVPAQTVRACHPPYPGRTRQADPGTGPPGHGLRRDMTGSAPPPHL